MSGPDPEWLATGAIGNRTVNSVRPGRLCTETVP